MEKRQRRARPLHTSFMASVALRTPSVSSFICVSRKMPRTVGKFVQLVEMFPCLYNSQVPDYARKDVTESAWTEVANEMNWTVPECKEKWKNIRNGFVRSLKPKLTGYTNCKKKYYLHEEMQFVMPYLKPAIFAEAGIIPAPECMLTEEDRPVDIKPLEDHDDDKPLVKKPKKLRLKEKNDNKMFPEWCQNKQEIDENPRKLFLVSLLPDVDKLSDEQMSAFRIKVLMLLEEIKCTQNNQFTS